ncbi:putative Gamma-tubulin ring complex protein [Paratrimastix pyriformis]|uniref:Gamma-tubulin ring complex protein n=1 Tax=Paratrimastix pyriformis TaxID=342808 RepID=A0ABQ8U1U4_9EUKA|nr:putative Gamma-tubulin ring complex protein [Paratrimastix pyriformis]
MLFECLHCLEGITGDVFIEDHKNLTFRVADGVPLSTPEILLYNRIGSIGWAYSHLSEWCGSFRNGTGDQVAATSSQYVRTLCSTLDNLTLDKYREILVSTIDDPTTSVTSLLVTFTEYELLFPPLLALKHEITTSNLAGGMLLGALARHTASGVPAVRRCMLQTAFQVQPRLVPVYVRLACAEAVLFIGKAVRTLPTATSLLAPSARSRTMSEDDEDSPDAAADDGDDAATGPCAGLRLSGAEEGAFVTLIAELRRMPTFTPAPFERAVESMRLTAAQHLWSYLVDQSHLLDHITAWKDIGLLGRGDLYQCFVEESRPLMQLSPGPTAQQAHICVMIFVAVLSGSTRGLIDVQVPWQAAVQRSGLEDDPFVRLFQPCILPESAPGPPGPPTPAAQPYFSAASGFLQKAVVTRNIIPVKI